MYEKTLIEKYKFLQYFYILFLIYRAETSSFNCKLLTIVLVNSKLISSNSLDNITSTLKKALSYDSSYFYITMSGIASLSAKYKKYFINK